MSFSVIVPSRGTSETLMDTIASIVRAIEFVDEPGAELIVVLNGPTSTDATVEASNQCVRVLREPLPGAARARNIGMEVAGNDIFLFTDDDCVVPWSWCRDHLAALRHSSATAAPVQVPHLGPITRYLDYKRSFTAPPLDTRTCRYFVTANCGLNRSKMSWIPEFDGAQFNNAAEDAALGYQIVERGGDINWLADARPVVHQLSEEPEELLERTFRYGVGNAKIVTTHRRWQESSPYADDWLRSILSEDWIDYRKFPEFISGFARRIFTALNIVEATAWLVGYIDQTQRDLMLDVFSIDRLGLEADLQEFLKGLLIHVEIPDIDEKWEMQPKLLTTSSRPADDYKEIAKLLRRSIALRGDAEASRLLKAHLRTYEQQVEHEQLRIRTASMHAWQSLISSGSIITESSLESELRAHGATFADGMTELEKALGTL